MSCGRLAIVFPGLGLMGGLVGALGASWLDGPGFPPGNGAISQSVDRGAQISYLSMDSFNGSCCTFFDSSGSELLSLIRFPGEGIADSLYI